MLESGCNLAKLKLLQKLWRFLECALINAITKSQFPGGSGLQSRYVRCRTQKSVKCHVFTWEMTIIMNWWCVWDLGLDLVCVALGQLLLAGGRDQDVTVGLQDVSFVRRRVWEAHNGPVGLETINQSGFSPLFTVHSLLWLVYMKSEILNYADLYTASLRD